MYVEAQQLTHLNISGQLNISADRILVIEKFRENKRLITEGSYSKRKCMIKRLSALSQQF